MKHLLGIPLIMGLAMSITSCLVQRPERKPYVPRALLFQDLNYTNENLAGTYQMVILRDATAYVYYQHGKPKMMVIGGAGRAKNRLQYLYDGDSLMLMQRPALPVPTPTKTVPQPNVALQSNP